MESSFWGSRVRCLDLLEEAQYHLSNVLCLNRTKTKRWSSIPPFPPFVRWGWGCLYVWGSGLFLHASINNGEASMLQPFYGLEKWHFHWCLYKTSNTSTYNGNGWKPNISFKRQQKYKQVNVFFLWFLHQQTDSKVHKGFAKVDIQFSWSWNSDGSYGYVSFLKVDTES